MTEAHGGYLARYQDFDVAWLTRLARESLTADGANSRECALVANVAAGQGIVRFAFDGTHTYGRRGARWYETHHAFAMRLSSHLSSPVQAYAFDPEYGETVAAYGAGRRIGGDRTVYDEVEFPEDDAEFEALKSRWPIGHLAMVYGVKRDALLRLVRSPSAYFDLARPHEAQALWRSYGDREIVASAPVQSATARRKAVGR